MKLPTIILTIIALYLSAFFSHAIFLQKTVYGDGIFYYSWLRSVVVDHDVNFTNDYAHFHVTQPTDTKDAPGNKYSIGPAELWSPAYLSVHTMLHGDGWGLPYQLAVGFTSVLAALFGLAMTSRFIKKSPGVTGITILLIAGATNLVFYGSLDAVNSHALSFFAAATFVALLTSPSIEWVAVGVFLGVLSSIRLQDAVFVILIFPYWKKIRWLPLLGGFAIAMLPQLFAWYALYGSLANPYLTGGEHFDFLHPHILGVLFSPTNGLLLWTPIVAVGIYGLMLKWRTYWSYIAVFVAELLIVASWSTWWQGASVSGRMFVSTLPIIAIGLSTVIEILYRKRLIRGILPLLAGAFCLINAMGIFYYLFTN